MPAYIFQYCTFYQVLSEDFYHEPHPIVIISASELEKSEILSYCMCSQVWQRAESNDIKEQMCTPAEKLPQVQVLYPLNGFYRLRHGPLIQPGHFFVLKCVSAQRDELLE